MYLIVKNRPFNDSAIVLLLNKNNFAYTNLWKFKLSINFRADFFCKRRFILRINMKIIANKFFMTMLFLLGSFVLFAGPTPPPPNFKKPPPPPGLPIDEDILTLVVFAVLFGIYFIYNHNIKTKTPI